MTHLFKKNTYDTHLHLQLLWSIIIASIKGPAFSVGAQAAASQF